MLVFMLERGAPRDVEAWAAGIIRRLSQHIFRIGETSITVSGSVGIGLIDARNLDPHVTLVDALRARRRAEEAGGNRVIIMDHADDDTRRLAADKVWVQQIESALMANRSGSSSSRSRACW